MKKSHYRADIDGLRAVAVISVLLFHYGVGAFSGGFIGVDVFFVISGFLITRLIKDEMEAGHFTALNFYLRRARRLFPALFITLVACFACAYFVFSSQHFERFGGALLHAILSISNIYFWNEQGYFDTDAVFKPLLHTWTLSVEEQFYLIWPALLLLLLSARCKPYAIAIIILIGTVSLYTAQFYLAIDANAVFFLTPFRFYEFCIGAVTVWLVQHQIRYWLIEEIILFTGLALICLAIFTFDNNTPFPGINALIPCIGAALVIYAGRAHYLGKLLSNPIAVKIGLISYSIYLIHWPVYVFYQYPAAHSLESSEIVALSVITFVLSIIMYYLIESPFRRLKIGHHQISATGFAFGCLLLALISTFPASHLWKYDGWKWRFQHQQSTVKQLKPGYDSEMKKRLVYVKINLDCNNNISAECTSDDSVDGLVVGDSHAVDGFNALTIASKGRHRLSILSLGGCNPVVNPDQQIPARWPARKKCLEINQRWFDPRTYSGFDYLAVSSLFGTYFRSTELKEYLHFIKTQTRIKHIIVFGNYIQLTQPLSSIIENGETLLDTVLRYQSTSFVDNTALEKVCKELGCLFINKKTLFCKDDHINTCKLEKKGIPFTWDRHHLSLEFSTLLGHLAAKKIKRYLNGATNTLTLKVTGKYRNNQGLQNTRYH